MTKTPCPTCGAVCTKHWVETHDCFDESCKDLSHICYRPLPQKPDLTKLREVFKEYIITATRKDFNLISLCKDIDNLIRTVKEVLDAEASNSDHNS